MSVLVLMSVLALRVDFGAFLSLAWLSVCHEVQRSREATTVTAIVLFNSLFPVLSFSVPSLCYLPPFFFPFFPSLPPIKKAHAEPSKHFDMRKESLPPPTPVSFSLTLSPHSLCRSSWLTPLCFKSRIPAQLLYLEPSHVQRCVRKVCLTIWVWRQGS